MQFDYRWLPLLFLSISMFLGGCSEPSDEVLASEASKEEDGLAKLESTISAAASYLARQIKEDGTFVYQVNMNPAVTYAERYNILQHAGATYSLIMYQERFGDPLVMEAIDKSVEYLREYAVAALDEKKMVKAVWSLPAVNKTGAPFQATLGNTGLGLITLCSYKNLKPHEVPVDELRALGRFLLYMQKEDGSFYATFAPEHGGRDDSKLPLSASGQAALALLMLYEFDTQDAWLEGASKALGYIARSRLNQSVVLPDQWALLATERLLALDLKHPVSPSLLVQHTKQVVTTMLATQNYLPRKPDLHGSFSIDGRVRPVAMRAEGLLAAHGYIPEGMPIHAYLAAGMRQSIDFLVRAQVKGGDFAGGFTRSTVILPGDSEEVKRANARSTEVRIDYVQHALSALIRYYYIAERG